MYIKTKIRYSDNSEELIKVNLTIFVSVKVVQNHSSLFLGDSNAIVDQSPSEVIHIQKVVSIIIHSLENPSNSSDSIAASL